MNGSLMGLEQHEWAYIMAEFLDLGELSIWFNFALTYLKSENVHCALFINEAETLL